MILSVDSIDILIYIYSDIKPDEILIDKECHIKINDFDLAKISKKTFFPFIAKDSPIPQRIINFILLLLLISN